MTKKGLFDLKIYYEQGITTSSYFNCSTVKLLTESKKFTYRWAIILVRLIPV